MSYNNSKTTWIVLLASVGALTAALQPANAARFEAFDDELEISINSKVQATASWRTQDRSNSIIAKRNIPGQGGGGAGNLCDDDLTSGSADPADLLGGCVLDAGEHQEFVDAVGYFSQNSDDGNIAYDKGDLVGSSLRLTTDLSAVYGEYGFSGRLIGYYDPALDGDLRRNTDFDLAANQQEEFELANRRSDEALVFATAFEQAFVYGNFALGDRTLTLTFGRQPISWGETTTFPLRSVNSINPPSVNRLNAAGGDSKEVFSPTEAIHMAIDLTDNVAMEAWYQFKFRSILDQLSPAGSFFSTSDVAGPGGSYAMLSFGKEPQDPSNLQDGDGINGDVGGARGCINPNVFEADGVTLSEAYSNGDADEDARTLATVEEFGAYRAHRGGSSGRSICVVTKDARDDGQYGIQFKAYSEALNDTEFGFYFHNTHSRLPYASFISAQQTSAPANGTSLDQIRATVGFDPADLVNLPTNLAAVATLVAGLQSDLTGALEVADTVGLVLAFPEDTKTWGTSFTTTFGDISVAGEFAYRQDDPVQIATVDLTLYALGSAFNSLRALAGPSFVETYRGEETCAANGEDYATAAAAAGTPYPACSRIASSTFIPGWERLDVGHASMTVLASYSDNPFSASQWLVIADISATKIYGMPDKSVLQFAPNGGDDLHAAPGRVEFEANPIEAPLGVPVPGLEIIGAIVQNPSQESLGTFADSFSWGFRVVNVLKYPNIIFGSSLDLTAALFLDINGNSPGPAGDFLEGRRKFFLDLNFKKVAWNLQIRHTWFTGAGDANLERDRDHAFVALGYEF